MAATVSLLFGICLAIYINKSRQKYGETVVVGRALVTKPFPRDSSRHGERIGRTKNPREEFEVARKRGMTDDEVRWIVDEFRGLGADMDEIYSDSSEGYYRLRIKRQRWLLDTLASGFGFSGVQKKKAAARLRELGEKDYQKFKEYLTENKPIEVDGKFYQVVTATQVSKLTNPYFWLDGDEYLPWNLCELDEVQREMVSLKYENEEWDWSRSGSVTKDFETEERYENLDDPFSDQNGFITPSGKIFPLSMEQVDRIRNANQVNINLIHGNNGEVTTLDQPITLTRRMGLLTYVKLLSPAQFKTLLLYRPEMAEQLMPELEK